tara:strand:- start:6980 stop:7195 length:216 start_codon:yes stop_codon:yes gene_type:complete
MWANFWDEIGNTVAEFVQTPETAQYNPSRAGGVPRDHLRCEGCGSAALQVSIFMNLHCGAPIRATGGMGTP